MPVTGQWYRTPLYSQSHLLAPSLDGSLSDTSLCGRLLTINESWWATSGWEDHLGVSAYLTVDTRVPSGNHCNPCSKAWTTIQVRRPSPFKGSAESDARSVGSSKLQAHQAMVHWFTTVWGEEVTFVLDS